jgi:AraC family transcriptional regulator
MSRAVKSVANKHFKKIQPALAYAAAHLDEDVSLNVLAGQASLSPFHLQRVFAAVAGESPKQLTLRLRLERAAVMLLTTRDTVLDVALACGFQSHEVFCRMFLRRFGMTPKAYRKRGFATGTDASQMQAHATLVSSVGPCIGLFHIREETNTQRHQMTYSITKIDLQPQPVLVVRRRVKRAGIGPTIGAVLPHIFQYAQQHGIALAGHPFTRYVDVGPGLLTIEPGMRVAASEQDPVRILEEWTKTSGNAEVVRDVLPGGPAAMTTHNGPYDTLQEAYAAIQEWFEAERLTSAGAPWEYYVTDPSEHPDPKDWKTDVFWPVSQ